MKKLFFTLIFTTLSLLIFSQNGSSERIYKHFGEWSTNINEHKISILAYITKNKVLKKLDSHEIKLNKNSRKKKDNNSIKNYETIYQYKIYLQSKSVLFNDTTSVWIYGVKIYINKHEITKSENGNGLIIAVKPKPTLIYTYSTNSSKELNFYIKWDKVVHGNKQKK
jgi:hypothetical protein